jgi:hypothetical protein
MAKCGSPGPDGPTQHRPDDRAAAKLPITSITPVTSITPIEKHKQKQMFEAPEKRYRGKITPDNAR